MLYLINNLGIHLKSRVQINVFVQSTPKEVYGSDNLPYTVRDLCQLQLTFQTQILKLANGGSSSVL